MQLVEDAFRQSAERDRIALVLYSESPHRNVVDLLDAFGKFVLPRHVIDRTGREHFDVCMTREPLGNVPRVQLRAAVDGVAVPLNDERELHCS